MSIKCIAWLRSAQPFLFPVSSTLEQPFFFFEQEFDSCVDSVNGVFGWLGSTFVDLADAQWRYIAQPSMHAACLEDHTRGTRTFFSPFWLFIIQTSSFSVA